MRRIPLATIVLCALLPLGCGDAGKRATPSDGFVDSVGVNVHVSYTDTAYGRLGEVRAALRDLRVRHVRDGIVLDREDQYAAFRAIAGDGVRVNLIMGDPRGRFGTGSMSAQLETLASQLEAVAETVEGPNEYDIAGDPNWPQTLRGYQERLYRGIKDDPALGHLTVVGPSIVDMGAWPEVGDLRHALDRGNVHPYPGGEPPRQRHLREQLALAAPGSGSEPVFATETGYHNAVAAPPPAQPGVSERAAAAYIPRLLLEHFELEIERTFLYELVDEKPDPSGRDAEQHFGLVRNDFTRKPAYAALRNMLGLLEDRGPPFEPGRLDYSVKAGAPLRELLLQKRDGTFYLALWRPEVAAWSHAARRDVRPPPVSARVRFPGGVERVRAYVPAVSDRPASSEDDVDSVTVELGADVVLIEVEED